MYARTSAHFVRTGGAQPPHSHPVHKSMPAPRNNLVSSLCMSGNHSVHDEHTGRCPCQCCTPRQSPSSRASRRTRPGSKLAAPPTHMAWLSCIILPHRPSLRLLHPCPRRWTGPSTPTRHFRGIHILGSSFPGSTSRRSHISGLSHFLTAGSALPTRLSYSFATEFNW